MPTRPMRPPVVTILGHVDHGKTSLLDRIRKANVAAGEVGGITQAIGAYQIEHSGKKLTFIDTPGHAAFSAMRRRGGQAADIAILVVAADDSVMPQTKESIEHIKDAGIPFVVAVNKTDLPGINLDKVKTGLAECGVYVEGYGGNVPIVNISAKTGTGVDELLEVLLLLADLEELVDNSDETPALGLVIESALHPQKGPLATLLVKQGTLNKNANLFDQGKNYGKIRSMTDFTGRVVESAPSSTPVQIIGFSDVPNVGDLVSDIQTEDSVVENTSATSEVSPEKPSIVLKADVQGSLEAIIDSVKDKVNLISVGVGNVNESDITAANNAKAEIIGFNCKLPATVSKLADVEGVKFSNFKIIYQLFDYLEELKTKKENELGPKFLENGQAKVLKVFNFGGTTVYGCVALSGKIKIQDNVNQTVSRITSLKADKEDVEEVKKDQEFGAVITPVLNLNVGDIITSYIEE